MSNRINSSQVRTRHGLKVGGTPVYGELDTVLNAKRVISNYKDNIAITLGVDSDNLALASGKYPTGNVFVDGSTYEAINGGTPVEIVSSLGTASSNITTIAGREMIGKLYTKDSTVATNSYDEVLIDDVDGDGNIIGKKEVFVSIQATGLTDGDATADSTLQLSFLIFDDTSGAFKTQIVPVGDYYYSYNKVYTLNTLSEAGLLGANLYGNDVGGFALDELYPMDTVEHGYMEGSITAEITLPSNKTVVFKNDGKLYDTDGVAIGTYNKTAFPNINTSDIGNDFGTVGLFSNYNGVDMLSSLCTVVAKDEFNVVIDMYGSILYKDDTINIKW